MDNQYKFQKLTPFTNVDMGVYENAMEYIFANNDVRNIAISGAYGAGKSSMIESYKKKNPSKKFIHISLAHFVSEKADVEKEDENKAEDNNNYQIVAALEGKIINQLVHQIEPEEILQTNFRVKKDLDTKKILHVTILITVFIAITCFLRFKNVWDNMINGFSIQFLRKLFYFTTVKEVEFLLGAIALFILARLIYELIKLQKTTKLFKKLNLQGNEIEIFEESKDSYFDKYLNEVLYLFEHAKVDGIVFEDIDRYDTNLIFEKLREINYLLNQRSDMNIGTNASRVIRFFYLLRDDIFISKDRTKFFDFILPIVPVVDASNAYDQFIKHFKQGNLLQLFDTDFLQGLSLYVDDMRILKNIYNEFVIYHEQFRTTSTEQNNNKLLAMITYKNLFPRDFGALQAGTGYVHTLFEYKDAFKQDEIKRLHKEIDKLVAENKEINSELCKDLEELNAIYFSVDGQIKVGGKVESDFGSRKAFVHAILTAQNISKYIIYHSRWENTSIDSEKKSMEQNADYIKRKQLISKRSNSVIQKNSDKVVELKRRIEKIEQAYLRDIISPENENIIFSVNYVNALSEEEGFYEIKRSSYFALIKFLIRNGYIDETYPDYMTYFYADSITANDKIFLRSITDKRAKSYDYKLNNVELVISRMRKIDFNEAEALNYEVLEQLLSDKERYNAYLQQFFYNIWNNEPVEFVAGFLLREKARASFVKEFNKFGDEACEWILSIEEIALESKRQYIVDTLCVSSDETILANNFYHDITMYIENDADFLALSNVNEELIKNGLNILDVKFSNINFESANENLLQYVYNNCLYYINLELIQKILKHFYGIADTSDFLCGNLTHILSKEDEPLCKYVKENIDTYLEMLLANTEETYDTEAVIVFVLNNEDVSNERKKVYLASSNTRIQYLSLINDSLLWNDILDQDKIEQNESNLYDYYFLSGNGMDDRLVKYINSFAISPIEQTNEIEEKYGEESTDKLFLDIIRCSGINDDKYASMICTFGLACSVFDEKEIAPEKMDILITNNILEMNLSILESIRKNYPEKCITYIIKRIRDYVEMLDEKSFSSTELMQLLDTNIDDEIKLQLLQYETKPISIKDKSYSAKIQSYILKNLYCESDLVFLVQWYPKNRNQIRECILEIAIASIQHIIEHSYKVHVDLFQHLVQSDKVEVEDKKELLANHIKLGMEQSSVKVALQHIGLLEYLYLLDGKRPKIPVTDANEKLLMVLQEKQWISSYEPDKEDPSYYNTFGKMVRNKKKNKRI